MRKIFLILILLYVYPINVEASIFTGIGKIAGSIVGGVGSIFGGSKTHVDFSKRNTELENVRAELSTLSKNQVNMKELIKAEIKAEIQIEMENKIAAYDRSQKAGRDIINIKKNDAWMIMYIVGGIFAFTGLVVTGLITTIGLLIKKIFRMIKDRAETELKQTRLWLENMTKSKEEYKRIVQKNGEVKKI